MTSPRIEEPSLCTRSGSPQTRWCQSGKSWPKATCAYRLVAFGQDLPDWHHLVCGEPARVHSEGPSMRGEVIGEDEADWPE